MSYASDLKFPRDNQLALFSGQSSSQSRAHPRPISGERSRHRHPRGRGVLGTITPGKMKMALAWVEIHREEQAANWERAVNGQQPFRIEPLS